MREIKFRAWRPDCGMTYIDNLFWFEENGIRQFDKEKDYHEFSFMQYTGLKDEKGIEIYEGDIVKQPDGHVWKVVWFDNLAGFGLSTDNLEKTENLGWLLLEVIGNVYENPGLLE